jgi:ribonuclease Z
MSVSGNYDVVHRLFIWLLTLTVCCHLAAQTQNPPAADSTPIKVTLLGSGAGPRVDLQRYGISILVESGGQKLLFDCGRGVMFRLVEAGLRPGEIGKVFLTHLHSDHIVSLPDLLLTAWVTGGRKSPLQVWGPSGTRSMMDKLLEAFAFDIHMRRDVDEKTPKEGFQVEATDISEGVVYNKGGVKVSAFLVDHGPVKPAFGYRVDFGGHSIAMSGDTRLSENLIRHSQGVDVLFHEVGRDVAALIQQGISPEQAATIADHHTSAKETGIVFNRVKPRLAVYAHGGDVRDVAEARKTYSGPLEVGEDLMVIRVGEKIDVQRPRRTGK